MSLVGHSNIVKTLFQNATDKNAFITFQDTGGETALPKAAFVAGIESVKLLLDGTTHCDDFIFIQVSLRDTAIHSTIKEGYINQLECVPDVKVSITLPDRFGDTLLHLAAE